MTIRFREINKHYVVLFNNFNPVVNPKAINLVFPIAGQVSDVIQLSAYIPDLNKLIDERSRVQAIIIS